MPCNGLEMGMPRTDGEMPKQSPYAKPPMDSRRSGDPPLASCRGYREALIESAVCINAAHAAFELRQEMERAAKWEIEVLYGVRNIRNHQVCMPVDPTASRSDDNVRLAQAPTNPREFHALAIRMAEILKSSPNSQPAGPESDGHANGSLA